MKRGDIVSVDFPFSDGSGSKFRPALVISNNKVEPSGDVILLMISSVNRPNDITFELLPQMVSVPLPKNSFVKCHRLFSVDAKLMNAKLSEVNMAALKEINSLVTSLIS